MTVDAQSVVHGRAGPEQEGPGQLNQYGALQSWCLLAVVAVVSGIALWEISPRFEIDTPSLVDDWSAVSRSPDQVSDLARLANPEEQRFRPGWILWNYVQWHTLDAPSGLVGPNLWNAARLLVLVAGLTLLTALALPLPQRAREAALHAGLAAIPALLVVTVPRFGVDLARFGPQETLLLGGMTLGGSLLVLAGRSLLDVARPVPRWRTSALAAAGSFLWILGTYQKETSLAALPLVGAVLIVGRSRLVSWGVLSSARRVVLAALSAVVVLPLLHVAIESARIVARGELVYDAEVDAGLGATAGFVDLVAAVEYALPPFWRVCALEAVILTGIALAFRRRLDVVALGAFATGVLALVLAGQSGVVTTRYFIPAFALCVVPLPLSLARLPRLVQLVVLVVIFVALVTPTSARDEVREWTTRERREADVVHKVAGFVGSGCLVAVAGLDVERAVALPIVTGIEDQAGTGTCDQGEMYFVIGRRRKAGGALMQACAQGGLDLTLRRFARVYRCAGLREEPVRDPEFGLVSPERLVALRRLRLG